MRAETAIGDAFLRAGGPDQRRAALDVALALFRNRGGSEVEALEAVRAAFGTANPNADGEALNRLSIDQKPGASPSAEIRADGQLAHAKRQAFGAVPREPSPLQRRAAAQVARAAALTVLDTWKIRDGRAIGNVRFGELGELIAANAMEAEVLRQIRHYAVPVDKFSRVRDVVKAEELQRMIQRAAEVADAA